MAARESDVNPFLQGNFAPWRLEGTADDLEIVGAIPRDLNGTFYRNGPNPAYEPRGRYHWFDGDGMIHAITLRNGRAAYRNRWVTSDGLKEERAAGEALYPGLLEISPSEAPNFKITANTNIVFHAGKLLALVEAAPPTLMTAGTLETVGLHDFGGKLIGPMTAHPKLDPITGEMLFFGYSPFPPYLQYHVADRDGALVRSETIDIAWPSMIHDFAITEVYVVFILCPLVFSFEQAVATGKLFSWEPERGTRIGVMPRAGGNDDVRWYETDASYVFHPMNAYAEDDAIVLDVSRYDAMHFMEPEAARHPAFGDTESARLHRWRIDLRPGGGIASTPLDDTSGEFPRVDERRVGRKHRFGYLAATAPEDAGDGVPVWSSIKKYDLERGTSVVRRFGAANGSGEPLFVPRHAEAEEDDGYVLTLVYDQPGNASDFYVLDARNIAGEPIAIVRIPNRVPYGFHGNWVAA
jgi:carotenoid cleavage dioxygenase-like enzyme